MGGRAVAQAFQPVRGSKPSTNGGTNKRMETADRGRQTAVAQAFQAPRGEQTVNEWENE
jgi:hypothetical protein